MVTIPTIDQISGTTVMNKMRSLINNYISFAGEISDEFTDLTEFVNTMYVNIQAVIGTVNQAVETANAASETAQESATIVSGYNDRLTNVENKYVTKDTNQEITSFKTFTRELKYNTGIDETVYEDTAWNAYSVVDKNNTLLSGIRGGMTSAGIMRCSLQIRRAGSIKGELVIENDVNNNTYVKAPYRAYASGNTNDVITIASLASNPNVVHTVGNETVAGDKKFISNILVGDNYGKIYAYNDNNGRRLFLSALNSSNAEARIEVRMNEDGSATLLLRRVVNGVFTDVTIATIPA